MSAWTVPLRPGLAISFDGEQFTVAEIEGRRILLQQAAVAGTPKWRQVDISALLSHPTTQVLVDAPEEEPAAAAVLSGLEDSEDDALTVRLRHVQEVRTSFQLGTEELALQGEPRPDYAPGVPLMHRYTAKAAERRGRSCDDPPVGRPGEAVRSRRSGERTSGAPGGGLGGSAVGGCRSDGAEETREVLSAGAEPGPAGDRGTSRPGPWPGNGSSAASH
ncbi:MULTISPECIES: hypothetical protein [unclassified Streptomyces]|uniref:hypothetical protein n=1 Tax=unclassified Streptomyces TaxID=2593676 RepID=UPI000B84C5E8|nr:MULTISPECIES: hypothetical protein [unclassified Streptomyces]MYZ39311.1 hypothetical protein [Streptomyces sp. SID4917]